MIRKQTVNENYLFPGTEYLFEQNGYRIALDESQFRQLTFESISLLDDLLKEKWQNHFEKMKNID